MEGLITSSSLKEIQQSSSNPNAEFFELLRWEWLRDWNTFNSARRGRESVVEMLPDLHGYPADWWIDLADNLEPILIDKYLAYIMSVREDRTLYGKLQLRMPLWQTFVDTAGAFYSVCVEGEGGRPAIVDGMWSYLRILRGRLSLIDHE